MTNNKHQWTTFQKGRMKLKACACCGEMKLPSNTHNLCKNDNLIVSPIVRAGYQLSAHLPVSVRLVA